MATRWRVELIPLLPTLTDAHVGRLAERGEEFTPTH